MDFSKVHLQTITLPFGTSVKLMLLRLDLIDEEVSGNKWFKLKENIAIAIQKKQKHIITFGGAYSNHIAATAKACKMAHLECTGIIRGEKVTNATLALTGQHGMSFQFISRGLYRDKTALMQWLSSQYEIEKYHIIPEGGANAAGVEGCKEIVSLIPIDFNYIAMACGTGTTIAGVVQQLQAHQTALGFSALKGGHFLYDAVKSFIPANFEARFKIMEHYHFGGYAKYSPDLLHFMKEFEHQQSISLDFIYTAKMMYGLFDLIQQNYFPEDSTIVAIHSGGLQGNAGIGI